MVEEEAKKKLEEEEKAKEQKRIEEEKRKAEEERKKKAEEEEAKRQEALLNWKKAELLAKEEREREKMRKCKFHNYFHLQSSDTSQPTLPGIKPIKKDL